MKDIDMTAANELPARGQELMCIMTRFEYALKEIGYGKSGNNEAAEASWDEFANKELKAVFFEKIKDKSIAPNILLKPPSRQILRDRSLDWAETAKPNDIQSLIGAVRRVRNNLVHGGKSGDKDSDRNNHLVAEAIEILKHALLEHVELRAAFERKW